ncbi:hypothetical protein LTR35_009115 [Friedmanniomyces endolithicus]|uniref:Uncharacterized protein n=1 Tax=Friedmanniomyces endolithicus TaxID=329885 RepID=A0AAN6FZG7_9PEZI|nr:hypothetical protein LTR35_009115 [Friedmanniomyces endolithicus]KAK0327275.1 hypothetical protein LTR82_002038 [Friedmanniomyces endolithicus]KAK1016620.1 hypothetical protein LTR54_003299 [Friedmanniomyces endolithicus]
MGVSISKTALSPLSLLSILIGFISFAFTVATFLRVLWANFMTLGEAQHEVHSYLTNLRTELLEEQASLKVMKKNCRRHHRMLERGSVRRVDSGVELDEVTLKTMGDSVRQLIKRFKGIERPFLEPGDPGIGGEAQHQHRRKRRRDNSGSVSPYEHSAYASPPEKAHKRARGDGEARLPRYADEPPVVDEEDPYWAVRTKYADYSFRKRMRWIVTKPAAQQLFEDLTRVQTRRIARQVAGLSVLVHEYGSTSVETGEVVRRIEERMSRFVGVRRVED